MIYTNSKNGGHSWGIVPGHGGSGQRRGSRREEDWQKLKKFEDWENKEQDQVELRWTQSNSHISKSDTYVYITRQFRLKKQQNYKHKLDQVLKNT